MPGRIPFVALIQAVFQMSLSERWLGKLTKLKVDRATGDPAPHKPILILVVLELADQGLLSDRLLVLTPELAFRFFSYWEIVRHRRKQPPNVRLPFYHLDSDGIWTALDENQQHCQDRQRVSYALLSDELLSLLASDAFRQQARQILITKYFRPEERLALYALCGTEVPTEEEAAANLKRATLADAQQQGREVRFRVSVVSAYHYTCILTGYRLTTVSGGSIVDAAHIRPFASSRNNDPQNGLALCKNAHWLFDQGLWTVTDDYRILVADQHFAESYTDGKPLRDYQGAYLQFPRTSALRPCVDHLAWHRRHVFQY